MLLAGLAGLLAACGTTGQVPSPDVQGDAAVDVTEDVVEASTCDASEVKVDSVTPSQICPGASTSVTITGAGFMATPAAFMREPDGTLVPMTDVVLQSSTTLTAVATPSGIAPPNEDVVVVNPDGCSGVLPGALLIWCEGPKP